MRPSTPATAIDDKEVVSLGFFHLLLNPSSVMSSKPAPPTASSGSPATMHLEYEPKGISEANVPARPLAEHGPLIDHDIPQADAIPQRPDLWWSRVRQTLRDPFSEFFGVFILILFGDGVVAQVVLSGGKNGSYQSINWGWA